MILVGFLNAKLNYIPSTLAGVGKMRNALHSQFMINALSVLSLATVWEITGRLFDSVLIPPLTKIGVAWYKLLLGGKLLPNLTATLWAMVIGFVLAVLSASLSACSWAASAPSNIFSTSTSTP